MIKAIRTFLAKHQSIQYHYWDWRAVYPDGTRTYRLAHDEALSLTKVFGGTLIYDPPIYSPQTKDQGEKA